MTPPRITIKYCPKCNWMLRASWMGQEILSSFSDDIEGVLLYPENEAPGVFEISIDKTIVWERKTDGGFPGASELKKRIRDIISPDRDLGHHDKPQTESKSC